MYFCLSCTQENDLGGGGFEKMYNVQYSEISQRIILYFKYTLIVYTHYLTNYFNLHDVTKSISHMVFWPLLYQYDFFTSHFHVSLYKFNNINPFNRSSSHQSCRSDIICFIRRREKQPVPIKYFIYCNILITALYLTRKYS